MGDLGPDLQGGGEHFAVSKSEDEEEAVVRLTSSNKRARSFSNLSSFSPSASEPPLALPRMVTSSRSTALAICPASPLNKDTKGCQRVRR